MFFPQIDHPTAQREPQRYTIELWALFSPDFLERYTDTNNITAFFQLAGESVQCWEDISLIPKERLDECVRAHTPFSSWLAMMDAAVSAFFSNMYHQLLEP